MFIFKLKLLFFFSQQQKSLSFSLDDLEFNLEFSRQLTLRAAQAFDYGNTGAYDASLLVSKHVFGNAQNAAFFANAAVEILRTYGVKHFDFLKMERDIYYLFNKTHCTMYGESNVCKLASPAIFPLRRLKSKSAIYLDGKVQQKIYPTPFALLKDARGYLRAGNSVQASEKAYFCYSATVKHYFKTFRICIEGHPATRFLARLASECHPFASYDLVEVGSIADNIHRNAFRGFHQGDELEEMIDEIEKFSIKFSQIDKKSVKEKLQRYLPQTKEKDFPRNAGKYHMTIRWEPKPFSEYIFGAGPFYFRYKCR
ncbi:unnamed protein product [Meloidogyne enterolobii]|uniref:Uncharacterized protein n=1 Tax=Meloidogyne enterolobii TaxID=390850 RepID=A0ACB0Z9Q7_MELEN